MQSPPASMTCYDLLLQEHYEHLHHAIGMLVLDKELGEEIFQQTIIQGWRKFAGFREDGSFFSWMLSIAYSVRANLFQQTARVDRNKRRFFQKREAGAIRLAESFDPQRQVLKEEEKRVAHDALPHVDEKDRIYYGLYHEDDLSIAKVAEKCGVSEGAVKRGLARAQTILDHRIKRLIAAYLTLELFRGNTGALASDAMQKAAETPPEHQMAATGGAVGFLDFVRSWISSFIPFMLTIVHSYWLLALNLGGLLCGAAIVRDAPTLHARRWLIVRILHCYVGLLAVPFLFGLLDISYRFGIVCGNEALIVLSVVAAVGVAALGFLVWLVVAYRKVCRRTETGPMKTDEAYLYLERSVRRGLRLGLSLILAMTAIYGCGLVVDFHRVIFNPSVNVELSAELLLIAVLWMGGFGVLHLFVSRRFHLFLNVCKDEESFHRFTSPESKYDRFLHELAYSSPFVLFLIIPKIYHLFFIQTRLIFVSFELPLFLLWWWIVLKANIVNPRYRWFLITGTFLLQLILTVLLRQLS